MLAYAGSQGSSSVNEAVLDMLKIVAPAYPHVQFLLAAGKKHYSCARQLYQKHGLARCKNVEICEYIYDMPLRMAAADIVISRAGAMSLSELCLMSKASIVIPSPYVPDNHQYYNAKALADQDAVLLVEEKDFSGGALPRALLSLLDDGDARRRLQSNIRATVDTDANRRIYELMVAAVEKYHGTNKRK